MQHSICRSFCCPDGLGVTRLPVGSYWSPVIWCNECYFQRYKLYWTLTNLSASDIFNLKDTVLINASVFGSTVGSSTKAAHGIDWTNWVMSVLSKVLRTTVENLNDLFLQLWLESTKVNHIISACSLLEQLRLCLECWDMINWMIIKLIFYLALSGQDQAVAVELKVCSTTDLVSVVIIVIEKCLVLQ